MAFVVVDVVPREAGEFAAVAVASCDAALGVGRCHLAQSDPPDSAKWYAVVRWADERPEVLRIELRTGSGSGQLHETRELTFSARDEARDRWASAGVMVAAMVVARERDLPPAEQPHANKPSPPAPPVQRPAKRTSHESAHALRLRLDLGAMVGRSLSRGSWQIGALTRASLAFPPFPLFAMGSAAYSLRPSTEPEIAWLSGSLGVGVLLTPNDSELGVELRTEAVVSTWYLKAEAPSGEPSESTARTRFGPRLGLDGVWAVDERWALVAGAEATLLRPAIIIDVSGQTVERIPPFGWSVLAALRFAP